MEQGGAPGSVRVTQIMHRVAVGSAVDQCRDTSVVPIVRRKDQLAVEVLGLRFVGSL